MTPIADRIAEWRAAHPTERLSVPVLLDILGLTTLHGANLVGANLREANLYSADLYGAYLYGAMHEHILPINAGASGMGALYPQVDGWHVSIGCWRHHTLDELADLLADRIDWPEAVGEERERRRPLLAAIRAACDAFIDQMPADLIEQHAAAREAVRHA